MSDSRSQTDRIIQDVEIKLKNYFLEVEDDRLKKLTAEKIVERPFSTIVQLQAQTSTKSRRFVMKTLKHHPSNKIFIESGNQALVEYNILNDLYPKFRNIEKCSVPCPIAVIPEFETYIMEFVEGQLLIDELRWDRYFSSRRKFAELQEHFYNSGRWLRHFQEITGVEEAGLEVLLQSLDRAKSILRLIHVSAYPGWPKNLTSTVKSVLDNKLRELSGAGIPASGRHSDFQPLNILAGRGGITVIDFMGYKRDCVAVDPLSMLVHLEDEERSLTASCRRVGVLRERFLEGYGEIRRVPSAALFICEAMQRIVSIWGNISALNKHIHHKWEAKECIRRHVKWLVNERERKYLWP